MSGTLRRRDVLAGGAAVMGAGVLGSGSESASAGTSGSSPGLFYYRPSPRRRPRTIHADVCVYGATSAGVIAAVAAARLGCSAVLVSFGSHVGGMTSGGLGFTDVGVAASIGGLSRQFYQRVGAVYGVTGTQFTFEPHVAEQVFEDWLAQENVPVRRLEHLARVRMHRGMIEEITMESGLSVRAAQYVDASYEGDLMAAAGVTFTTGREASSVYSETWNGYHIATDHQFKVPVDPYRTPGDPASGLLPLISAAAPGTTGAGDRRIQAYNFRLCLTKTGGQLPFPEPRGYQAGQYEVLLRYLQAGVFDVFGNNQALPNGKSDLNNNGAVATDFIGGSIGWPTGSYAQRERMFQRHVQYQQGLLYFLANDPDVPDPVRTAVSTWGLAADEFTDTGGWPHELYVREGRRMVSGYVVTEHDCMGQTVAADPVGLASYTMDSHNCQRIVIGGHPSNEGNVETPIPGPFPVSYRSIVPRPGECANLAVPAAMSASHIGYGSVRLEPVFMILGQAAGTAAVLAARARVPLQQLDYPALRAQLLADGALLEWPVPAGPFTLTADHAVPAGGSATATATLMNQTTAPLTSVTLALAAPAGWQVSADTPVTFASVAPGAGAAAVWAVTPPVTSDALARGTLTAAGAGNTASATVYVQTPVAAPYQTFASAEAYFGQSGTTLGIAAAGNDVWTDGDEYGAIYSAGAAGPDAVLTVQVLSQDPTNPNARAGLMVRDDVTGAGASPGYIIVAVKPQDGFLLLWDGDGDGLVESAARAGASVTPYPCWLRLERAGTSATGLYSTDGTTWNVIGQASVPEAAANQDAAVFVCSHDPGVLGLAVFDGFTITA